MAGNLTQWFPSYWSKALTSPEAKLPWVKRCVLTVPWMSIHEPMPFCFIPGKELSSLIHSYALSVTIKPSFDRIPPSLLLS